MRTVSGCLASLFLALVFAASSTSCTSRTDLTRGDDLDEGGEPSNLWRKGNQCLIEEDLTNLDEAFAEIKPGEAVALVEVYFQLDCRTGGQYAIMRDLNEDTEYFVGSDSCPRLEGVPEADKPSFGVIRHQITAGMHGLDPASCIGFPGSPPGIRSAAFVVALALFEERASATRYFDSFRRDK